MLEFVDKAFFVLHALLILFTMVGWASRHTRVVHLFALASVTFSWFVLGWYYDWGYCVCTDWHFQIRSQLGYHDVETSYVQLLASHMFDLSVSRTFADWLAGIVYLLIVIATAAVWLRAWHTKRPTEKMTPATEDE